MTPHNFHITTIIYILIILYNNNHLCYTLSIFLKSRIKHFWLFLMYFNDYVLYIFHEGNFRLNLEKCSFVDWQRLRVQENADEIPPGTRTTAVISSYFFNFFTFIFIFVFIIIYIKFLNNEVCISFSFFFLIFFSLIIFFTYYFFLYFIFP